LNARDAMPRGGLLTLATRALQVEQSDCPAPPGLRPGPYVVLTVSDTGVGMDEATRQRIFEPFFTTKEPGKGTGLGLATVKATGEQCGGHIAVDSAPGRGSCFRVHLPRLPGPTGLAEEAPTTGRAARGHETVLLAEDDRGVRTLARAVLQHGGYTVLE